MAYDVYSNKNEKKTADDNEKSYMVCYKPLIFVLFFNLMNSVLS